MDFYEVTSEAVGGKNLVGRLLEDDCVKQDKEDTLALIMGASAVLVSRFLKPGDHPDWKLFEKIVSEYLDDYSRKLTNTVKGNRASAASKGTRNLK